MFRFLLLSLAFCATLPAFAQSIPHDSRTAAGIQLREGDFLVNRGLWEEALSAYTMAIEIDPDYAEAYLRRANLYRHRQEFSLAIADYNKAIRLNPYAEAFYDARVRTRILAMDLEGAEQDLADSRKIVRDEPTAREQRADAYLMLENYEAAAAELAPLLSAEFMDTVLALKQSQALLGQGELQEAEVAARRALDLNPLSSVAHDQLGLVLMARGEYAPARQAFDQALELNPEFALARFNRGMASLRLGNFEEALDDMNQAMALSRDVPNMHFARALTRKSLGDWGGALNDYNKALGFDAGFQQALFNRAVTRKMLGDYDGARRDAEQLLRLSPNDPQIWNLRGNVALLFDQFTEAISHYTQAINMDAAYAEAWHNRGIAHLMRLEPLRGCPDLVRSAQLGYTASERMREAFCTP
ncbi:MAG: tetratricopeptide repeat protein [Bacteroidetes bacterium]|nr:tetratricopeptide repeat protein [Bacteroidota bacterium]